MNILFQAYACSPDKGGEFIVSYGWLKRLDGLLKDDDRLFVMSLTLTKKTVADSGFKHVYLLEVQNLNKIKHLKKLYYVAWMKLAYKTAKNSGIKFDIIHIYSLSDFRMLGKWYKMKNCYTIFGPVGGGQKCPKGLISYDDSSHIIRDFINFYCKISPFYKSKVKRYNKSYVCNYETQSYINDSEILIDCPLNDKMRQISVVKRNNEVPVVLFCGRLINKKGLDFLVDIVSQIPENVCFELHIYGEGPLKVRLKKKLSILGLQNKIKLKGFVPYEKMSEVYNNADIFVLPSLRESGGSVLLEAMAHSLPIVALDMAMSKILNQHDTGIFINIEGSKDKIMKDFVNALVKLINSKQLREDLGSNGYHYVNKELTYDNIVSHVYGKLL